MIRLRIGDVIKSNYSKFNLARLFGLGEESFSAGGAHLDNHTTVDSDLIKQELAVENGLANLGILKEGDEMLLSVPKGRGYDVASFPGAFDIEGPSKTLRVKPPTATKVIITKVLPPQATAPVNGVATAWSNASTYNVSRNEVDGKLFENRPGDPVEEINVTRASLSHYPGSTNNSDFVSEFIAAAPGSAEEVAGFFSAENNTIVRSFNSAKGRGLAGVIKSMNFDWFTPTWETDTIGSKAPKYCKVDVSFTPIHDIAPGIDADGANRGPVYPVGRVINNAFGDVRDNKVIADVEDLDSVLVAGIKDLL